MNRLQSLRLWARRHLLAQMVGAAFLLFGWAYILPPHSSYAVAQNQFKAFGAPVLGVTVFSLSIPLRYIHESALIYQAPPLSLAAYETLSPALVVLLLLILVAIAVLIAWAVDGLVRTRRGRTAFIVGAVVNAAAGFLTLSLISGAYGFTDPFSATQRFQCENAFSEAASVRMVVYQLPDIFVLATGNGGQTWTQIMHLTAPDVDDRLHCRNAGWLNDAFFWIRQAGLLALTHDGGATWRYWTPADVEPDLDAAWVSSGIIEQVTFNNAQSGTLTLARADEGGEDERFTLTTSDGGLSWQVVE